MGVVHPSTHAAPLYEGENLDKYLRIYTKDHPGIDYYQETPNGTYFTPKKDMAFITLSSILTKDTTFSGGATFSKIREALGANS